MPENAELSTVLPLPPGTLALFSPALLIVSALSIYPWFVTNTILFYLLGIGLCVILFKFPD